MPDKHTIKRHIDLPNICTMTSVDQTLYCGSYEFDEEKTTGKIFKFCINNLINKNEIITSGTFHILQYNKLIISLNKTDISILDEGLNMINILETDHMNIFGEIYKKSDIPSIPYDILIVTTDKGYIVVYDLKNLCLQNNINRVVEITEGIVWSIFKYKEYLLFGTDDCKILIFDFLEFINSDNKSVHLLKGIKTETAPTFFNLINNDLYVLTYESFYRLKLNDDLFSKHGCSQIDKECFYASKDYSLIKMERGGWRFYELKGDLSDHMVILNDTGCYVFNKYTFNLIKHFETQSNCYSFVQLKNTLCFSAFYCNKIYLENIQ